MREVHPLNERDDPYNRIEDFGFEAGDRLRPKGGTHAVGTVVMTKFGLKMFYDGALEAVSGTRWGAFELHDGTRKRTGAKAGAHRG
jgi:hypothetical protein